MRRENRHIRFRRFQKTGDRVFLQKRDIARKDKDEIVGIQEILRETCRVARAVR